MRAEAEPEPYKFEPVNILMGLDELVDVPILHPLRHQHEFLTPHRHTQQRQYIRMTESIPGDYFFAKSLCESR